MLGINTNFNLEVKNVEYPIYFHRKNLCVHCGAEGKLTFIDIFGRDTTKEIHAFNKIKCTNCGKIYSIMWERDDADGKVYPSAVDPSFMHDIVNVGKQMVGRKDMVKKI